MSQRVRGFNAIAYKLWLKSQRTGNTCMGHHNWLRIVQQREITFFSLCAPRNNTKNNEYYFLGARFHFNIRKNFLTITFIIKSSRRSYKKVQITCGFKTKALGFSLIRKWPPIYLEVSYFRIWGFFFQPLGLASTVNICTLEVNLE